MSNQTNDPRQAFVEAFNARDLDALKALLSDDATAEVLGSGFGTEQGPDDIAARSLTHMLSEQDRPLQAEVFEHEGSHWVLFLNADRQLDTAARVRTAAGFVTRIEYTVHGFRRSKLEEVARLRGIELPREDD